MKIRYEKLKLKDLEKLYWAGFDFYCDADEKVVIIRAYRGVI